MPHRRGWRRFSSLLLCATLLFSRVALAAFACPNEMPSPPAMEMDCGDAKPDLANLCEQSCHDDPQKHESDHPVALPPAAPSGLHIVHAVPRVPAATRAEAIQARANAPPPIVLFGRLRV